MLKFYYRQTDMAPNSMFPILFEVGDKQEKKEGHMSECYSSYYFATTAWNPFKLHTDVTWVICSAEMKMTLNLANGRNWNLNAKYHSYVSL